MSTPKEELILNSLKEGRKHWTDLERELVKSGKMSKSTMSTYFKKLENEKKVKRILDSSKRPAISWYILAASNLFDEEKIGRAVNELRRELWFLREPTAKEPLLMVLQRYHPQDYERVMFKHRPGGRRIFTAIGILIMV